MHERPPPAPNRGTSFELGEEEPRPTTVSHFAPSAAEPLTTAKLLGAVASAARNLEHETEKDNIRTYYRLAFGVAARIVDRQEAQDVAQEALFRLLKIDKTL